MPINTEQPGEYLVGSHRFRVVPLGDRIAVHCELFPTVIFSRPRREVDDERRLVDEAARIMVTGHYGPMDVPRGWTWERWRAEVAALAATLADDEGRG